MPLYRTSGGDFQNLFVTPGEASRISIQNLSKLLHSQWVLARLQLSKPCAAKLASMPPRWISSRRMRQKVSRVLQLEERGFAGCGAHGSRVHRLGLRVQELRQTKFDLVR